MCYIHVNQPNPHQQTFISSKTAISSQHVHILALTTFGTRLTQVAHHNKVGKRSAIKQRGQRNA